MLIPQKQSLTSTIRKLCQEIESQVHLLISKHTVTPPTRSTAELQKLQAERQIQQLKNAIIQAITSRLPALISYEQSIQDKLQELTEQRDQWVLKYKKTFSQFEQNQLQNDALKIQVITLSQNYEQLSISFEELKYKYHQLQEEHFQQKQTVQLTNYMDKWKQINLISKDSPNNSSSEQDSPSDFSNPTEAMIIEKEMFLEEIRKSQRQIFSFKGKIQELLEDKERLERENTQLQQMFKGEKSRSDKFDREILQILNKNQELKLEALEQKELALHIKEQHEKIIQQLRQEKKEALKLQQKIEQLSIGITQQKQLALQLKTENSAQREVISSQQEKQFLSKQKMGEMNKQNQQLRVQLDSFIEKYNTLSSQYEKNKNEQLTKYQQELNRQRTLLNMLEQQQKSKTHHKFQEISKMHKNITHKLQQKIQLLEKVNKDKKQKCMQQKYEIQRLYESLQIQVQKQFKNTQKIKDMSSQLSHAQQQTKLLHQQISKLQQSKLSIQQQFKNIKFEFQQSNMKLKKIGAWARQLTLQALPKIKQELHSTRLLTQHFITMLQMQKQQTSFFLLKKQEHFTQLLQQSLLQKGLIQEQSQYSHQTQITKWKQNCKNYEEKYDRIQSRFETLQSQNKQLQIENQQLICSYDQKLGRLQQQNHKKHQEHVSTIKTIQKLKDKCKQVEQYYKLIEDLSKENLSLKNKLENATYYSFKSPDKHQFDNTSKRYKQVTSQEPLQKYCKTANMGRPLSKNEEINMNDRTAKAEFQKLRLQAAKREYNILVNKVQ